MKKLRKSEPLLFKTLADPTRLRLLNLLACGETCVCELADTLRVVQPKVSRHLARLKRAGLVDARPRRAAPMDGERRSHEWRTPPAQKSLLPN
jgi:DNA-binding transcriptional ArsR family regulator